MEVYKWSNMELGIQQRLGTWQPFFFKGAHHNLPYISSSFYEAYASIHTNLKAIVKIAVYESISIHPYF